MPWHPRGGEAGGGGGVTQTVSVSQLQAGRTSSGSMPRGGPSFLGLLEAMVLEEFEAESSSETIIFAGVDNLFPAAKYPQFLNFIILPACTTVIIIVA